MPFDTFRAMSPPVIVCVATRLEAERLYREVAGNHVEILITGVGVVAATYALTKRLSEAGRPG